ncbi:putative replication initiation protein [Hermit crab associated circular genome]|uniref:putative replication initiation protein n=1 Tax=Hermit crab associated circular genome TaxID=1692251 RepID=UPI0006A7440C|nr:putative replication initiation protein [Hermit crab associated circular genome]AKV62280.1 putative replication initiation protein [Hermit crab associated circular genome]
MISKRWCYTLNNYSEDDVVTMKAVPTTYHVLGKEVGTNGTPHIQGFLTFKSNKRLSAMKKINARAHWEVAKGTSKQAADYCKKDGNFEELGSVPSQGKRTDLEDAAVMITAGESLKRVAEEHPTVVIKYHKGLSALKSLLSESRETDDVRGIWLHGPPGCGKSHLARTVSPYLKAQNKWWDGYANEEYVLIDDFDKGGKCLGHYLKLWADKYECTGEIKGATVALNHRKFIITSNYHPDEIFDDDSVLLEAITRRFSIRSCWHHSREADAVWFDSLTKKEAHAATANK